MGEAATPLSARTGRRLAVLQLVATESSVLEDDKSTAIDRFVAKAAARHPGEPGFAIIRYGRRAFTTRVAFSQLAERLRFRPLLERPVGGAHPCPGGPPLHRG